MSRELHSDAVSSVDRSGTGTAEEQPASESRLENEFIASAADAMTTTAETVPADNPVTDEPSFSSNETSTLRPEEEETAASVSIVKGELNPKNNIA